MAELGNRFSCDSRSLSRRAILREVKSFFDILQRFGAQIAAKAREKVIHRAKAMAP
jgi:hypothetical protein